MKSQLLLLCAIYLLILSQVHSFQTVADNICGYGSMLWFAWACYSSRKES